MKRLADELLHGSGSAKFQRYKRELDERFAYLKGSEGAPVLVPYLIAALHNAGAGARSNAARSLGQLSQPSPELIFALIAALHDADDRVRFYAAESLGKLGQYSPEVIDVLLETIDQATHWPQLDSAKLLGKIGHNDELTIQALRHGLVDDYSDVRTACAEALAQLGRRFPDASETIEKKLMQAIEDPAFDKPDLNSQRSGHDYAYVGLWLLVVGGEIEGN
jgi:HEAT repeat protein